MSYSTNPEKDQMRDQDAKDAYNKLISGQVKHYSELIKAVYLDGLRKHPANLLRLPSVQSDSYGQKLVYVPLDGVISDQVTFGKPLAALLDVLMHSDCPHVQRLREVLANDYIETWVADIAEVTV